MVPRYRITATARADIVATLRYSHVQFGGPARLRYQLLISTALSDVASSPRRVGSADREDIFSGLRSYHLHHAKDRTKTESGAVGRPRHVVFYRIADDGVVEILRMLHDGMQATLHLLE